MKKINKIYFLIILAILISAVVFGIRGSTGHLGKINDVSDSSSHAPKATWKTYNSPIYGYSFNYPPHWGVGSSCGDERPGYASIGPESLKFPGTNCGTANIPSTMSFYISPTVPALRGNYKISEKETISFGEKTGELLSLEIIDPSQGGEEYYLQFSIPFNSQYLIAETGAYLSISPSLKTEFRSVISSLKFNAQ